MKMIRPPVAQTAMVVSMVLATVGALASTTPVAVGASGICLFVVLWLLWRGDDLPILLLPVLFQWSEVAILPISTIWQQVPLNALSPYRSDLEASALYGLAGVTSLAVGLRLGSTASSRVTFVSLLNAEVYALSFQDLARYAFAGLVAGYVCSAFSVFAGPAREILGQLGNVKYIGLFALAYWCLVRRSHYRVLAAVMIFEIVFGMTGFFAEFKNSVLTLFVAAIAARPRLRPVDLTTVIAAAAVIMTVSVFWSAVKSDYRVLVNEGTGAQVVSVPIAERVGYLADSAVSIDGARFADGFDRLVARHGYIEFLGLTMAHVPTGMPHEGGQLTLAVLKHISMPRLLFPDKAPLPSDTLIMAKYTGLDNSWNDNTSISIGYLGELYVDFGWIGGLLASVCIGWFAGTVYRVLHGHAATPALIRAGVCLMSVLPLAYFGTAYAKLIGSFVLSSAIAFGLQRFVFPTLLAKLALESMRRRLLAERGIHGGAS